MLENKYFNVVVFVAGIKCPVCSKFVLPDDIECHLVMCLTRPRLSYNGQYQHHQHAYTPSSEAHLSIPTTKVLFSFDIWKFAYKPWHHSIPCRGYQKLHQKVDIIFAGNANICLAGIEPAPIPPSTHCLQLCRHFYTRTFDFRPEDVTSH